MVPRLFALLLGALLLLGAGVAGAAEAPAADAAADGAPTTLAQAILGAIRAPKPGQFPTPEAAVRFFLEQVKKQDVDEALRVFPIRERLERETFRFQMRRLRTFEGTGPWPPAFQYHNVLVAIRGPLLLFENVTMGLLGVDKTTYVQRDQDIEETLRNLEARLDPARLRGMKIGSIARDRALTARSKQVPDSLKARGITQIQCIKARLACGGREVQCEFFMGLMGDNWRILFGN